MTDSPSDDARPARVTITPTPKSPEEFNGCGYGDNAESRNSSGGAFPTDELPDRIRAIVEAVADATGTDDRCAAVVALVTAAGAIGNRIAVAIKGGYTQPSVLWGAIVAPSGATKSPILRIITRPLYDIARVDRAAYIEARALHDAEVEKYKAEMIEWRRQKGAHDPPIKPPPPLEKRAVVSDITVEKLGALLQSNPLGLLCVRDELAAWIGSHDRYAAGGKGSDSATWLSFFDGMPATIDRKSDDGSIHVDRASVSLIGTIQPRTLDRVFGQAERESGLLARLLLVRPPDAPNYWSDAEVDDAVISDWRALLEALIAMPPAYDDDGALRPRLIALSDAARARYVEWFDRVEDHAVQVDDDDLRAHLSKLRNICLRLALIFSVVEVASGKGGAAAVSPDCMVRAIRVTDWFRDEAQNIYAELAASPADAEQRHLLNLIRRKGGAVTVRDVTHGSRLFQKAGAQSTEAALNALVKAGLGYWDSIDPTHLGGRPTRVFRLHDPADGPPDDDVAVTTTTENPDEFEV